MAMVNFQFKINQGLLLYFFCSQPACRVSVFHPAWFLRESGTEAKTAFKGSLPHPKRVEVSCCWVSEGSVAEESCDHSGASASSPLVELRDLQGDVY